jgi:O-antigen ligase
MWVLPFLVPRHVYPLTTFYQEWLAALLGLLAFLPTLRSDAWRLANLPAIVILPLGLSALVGVHWLTGRMAYPGQAMLLAGYFLWAALLMVLGRWLAERYGLPLMARVLAACLLLGGELSAVAGLAQHYHWSWLMPVVTAKVDLAVYGNLAQPNHFADYLALSLASLGFLHQQRRLPIGGLVALVAPLLFVMVLSGSRSSWLYLLALAGWFAVMARRLPESAAMRGFALSLLPAFVLMHGVVQLPWLAGAEVSTLDRMVGLMGGSSIRQYLWHESLLIFAQHPWLGAGFGQFAWQHFLLAPQLHEPQVVGLYNNAHDLPLHFSAETGVSGLLVLILPLGFWMRRVWRRIDTPAHAWALALLLVLGIHSLLEYPLWFTYFLGIAALLLGALDPAGHRARPGLGVTAGGALAVAGLVALLPLLGGYQRLERLVAMRIDDNRAWQAQYRGLHALTASPLLRPWAELYMNPMVQAGHADPAVRQAWNRRVMHFVPTGLSTWREVLLLGEAGRMDEAQTQMERALWAYPQDYAWFGGELEQAVRKDPGRWSPLLKFATQKYEEYQGAIHNR